MLTFSVPYTRCVLVGRLSSVRVPRRSYYPYQHARALRDRGLRLMRASRALRRRPPDREIRGHADAGLAHRADKVPEVAVVRALRWPGDRIVSTPR